MAHATSIGRTLGAIEIGSSISTLLFGILCVQVYIHYRTSRSRSNALDGAVALIWCLDLGHTITVTHATYTATITWYGESQRIDELITLSSLPLAVLASSLVELVVRVTYIRRIQTYSRRRYIPYVCYTISVLTCVGGLWVCVAAFQGKSLSGFLRQWAWLHTVTLSGIMASDSLIAGTYCYYLTKSEVWVGRPSELVDKLKLWTIETGLLTSLTALAQLICFHTTRSTDLAFIAIYVCLPKLYSNSLLALLNGRAALRDISPSLPNLHDAWELSTGPEAESTRRGTPLRFARSSPCPSAT